MLDCKLFYDLLRGEGIGFFTGVPDSLLKDFCAFVTDHVMPQDHVIAANEGGAVGMAAGHHLATGKLPLVYMQNSGQGNALNPLLSLCDKDVYGIPMLLLVGWRGEPGNPDEPQHVVQGRVTQDLFSVAGIPCAVLPDNADKAIEVVRVSVSQAIKTGCPVALLVRKGTFSPYTRQHNQASAYRLSREEAIEVVTTRLPGDSVIVASTGMASRELYECRGRFGADHAKDFLCIGGMGHASQIALGIALAKPDRTVFCLDGDGAALMHLGGLPIAAACKVSNYKHVVLNNGAHDSVGGQPTVGLEVDFCAIAKGAGYADVFRADDRKQLNEVLDLFIAAPGPTFLEIRVAPGARDDLGRPDIPPKQSKRDFMGFLHG